MKFNLTNIPGFIRNKYALTLMLFLIWILFFDQNNLVDRFRMGQEIRELETDRKYYIEEIEKDSARLHELTTDKENLEKYAREQYYMKKSDEVVYVVIEDDKK